MYSHKNCKKPSPRKHSTINIRPLFVNQHHHYLHLHRSLRPLVCVYVSFRSTPRCNAHTIRRGGQKYIYFSMEIRIEIETKMTCFYGKKEPRHMHSKTALGVSGWHETFTETENRIICTNKFRIPAPLLRHYCEL
jgi:hypothetical protein